LFPGDQGLASILRDGLIKIAEIFQVLDTLTHNLQLADDLFQGQRLGMTLLVFAPRLGQAKRVGLSEYGALAQRYVREFDQKWLCGGESPNDPWWAAEHPILGRCWQQLRSCEGMKFVPFSRDTVFQLAMMTLLPVAPLILTMIPLSEPAIA
jgi:hypothetical protein